MAFISAAVGTPLRAARPAAASRTRPAASSAATRMQTRPGLPPGEDARENAPLRYYVPVPVETYEKRSFATVLPKTWEGEVVTIGAPDVPELTEESIAESKLVPLSASSTAAFLEYSNMVKAERKAALAAYVGVASPCEGRGGGVCGSVVVEATLRRAVCCGRGSGSTAGAARIAARHSVDQGGAGLVSAIATSGPDRTWLWKWAGLHRAARTSDAALASASSRVARSHSRVPWTHRLVLGPFVATN